MLQAVNEVSPQRTTDYRQLAITLSRPKILYLLCGLCVTVVDALLATETGAPERLKQGSFYQPIFIFFQQFEG